MHYLLLTLFAVLVIVLLITSGVAFYRMGCSSGKTTTTPGNGVPCGADGEGDVDPLKEGQVKPSCANNGAVKEGDSSGAAVKTATQDINNGVVEPVSGGSTLPSTSTTTLTTTATTTAPKDKEKDDGLAGEVKPLASSSSQLPATTTTTNNQ